MARKNEAHDMVMESLTEALLQLMRRGADAVDAFKTARGDQHI